MVIFVRVALVTTVLALGVLAAGGGGLAQAARGNPSRAQIKRAIQRAERSNSLWATVNICDTKHHRHTMGVRGQMPTLGFASWLSMRVQVNYYSSKRARFVPLSKASSTLRLGRMSKGLQQLGSTFTFSAHAGLFNATIDFIWRRSGRLLGHTTRRTTAGHSNAAFGDPKHFSAKECRIA
jgi:hypothetical protein